MLFTVGGFGRRASDGGAHLQSYSQRAVSQPGSQEELKAVSHALEKIIKYYKHGILSDSYCFHHSFDFWKLK